MLKPAIFVLGPSGLEAARRAKASLFGHAPWDGAEIWGQAPRLEAHQVNCLYRDALTTLKLLFEQGRPLIAVCSAGIVVRALASSLHDKTKEPPVVVLAEDGSTAVPLLGGHHGANDLAQLLAHKMQGHAAITTAGDLSLGLALDQPPACWQLANPWDYKRFAARALAGEAVQLQLDGNSAGADWLGQSNLAFSSTAALRIRETIRQDDKPLEGELVYTARKLCIGVGCERNTAPDALIGLVLDTLKAQGLDRKAVAGVYSIDLKADEAAVHALAKTLGVPARFFSAQQLEAQRPYLRNPSEVVYAETGCHGVAEGAALAAADATQLLLPKIKGQGEQRGCTLALAFSLKARDPWALAQHGVLAQPGQARGRLTLIGLGPGDTRWRSHAAQRALEQASDWVGFSMYLDIAAADTPSRARQHVFPIGAEEERCRAALELAAQGRDVALLCSGDPGIYAMSALVLQLVDEGERADWARIALAFEPGITAMQGAVARSGALMGHDFCAISLSDLMTPWEQIERRIAAAAVSDFVIGFYNPVSMRRRWQLHKAREMLLKARPADTPVVIGRSIGRPEEVIEHTTLGALDPEAIDMLTVVCIGAASSRQVHLPGGDVWAYTPRGYKPRYHSEEDAV